MKNLIVGFLLGLALSSSAQVLTNSQRRKARLAQLRDKIPTYQFSGETGEAIRLLIDEVSGR
jgi:hypothetical protein